MFSLFRPCFTKFPRQSILHLPCLYAREPHVDDLAKDMRGIPSGAEIPGASLGIDSDDFFDLEEKTKRMAVIVAGYIAVELASEGGRTLEGVWDRLGLGSGLGRESDGMMMRIYATMIGIGPAQPQRLGVVETLGL